MRIVGVTGAIGSGKTTFCHALNVLAGHEIVFNCDERAKEFYRDAAFRRQIETGFLHGEPFSKQALSKVVFADDALLARLENMVFEKLAGSLDAWLAFQSRRGEKVVFVESAIFGKVPQIAARLDSFVEIVARDHIKRAAKRDGVDEEEILLRAKRGGEPVVAQFVIQNNGTKGFLEAQAREIYGQLRNDEG